MITFYTNTDSIIPWIKALSILYYDTTGKIDGITLQWSDSPKVWDDANAANSILIEVYDKDDGAVYESLLYNVTFFVSTGTVRVQGLHYDIFVENHFPVLRQLVEMIINFNDAPSTDKLKSDSVTEMYNTQVDDSITELKDVTEKCSAHSAQIGEIIKTSNNNLHKPADKSNPGTIGPNISHHRMSEQSKHDSQILQCLESLQNGLVQALGRIEAAQSDGTKSIIDILQSGINPGLDRTKEMESEIKRLNNENNMLKNTVDRSKSENNSWEQNFHDVTKITSKN